MPRLRINLFKELPFFALTDFQLRWENESYRQNIMDEKWVLNGFDMTSSALEIVFKSWGLFSIY